MCAQAFPGSLDQKLQAFQLRSSDRQFIARDPVTIEAVRKMVNVCGDRNPIYSDPDIAKRCGHSSVVAPPNSYFAWWLSVFDQADSSSWIDDQGNRRFRLDPLPVRIKNNDTRDAMLDEVGDLFAQAGYTAIAATGGELQLTRYPQVGDRLSYMETRLESLSAPKKTALGEGYFVTYCTEAKDSFGQHVSLLRITTYNFAPCIGAPDAPTEKKDVAVTAVAEFQPDLYPEAVSVFDDVRPDHLLPPLIVEVTPSLIIAGALFYHEEMDIHHDRDLAQSRGFNDIFMNTTTTLGLIMRFLGDWAGPAAKVEHLQWRLGCLQYPHDELRLTGKVVGLKPRNDRGELSVVVMGNNSLGMHVNCQVQLSLPINSPV